MRIAKNAKLSMHPLTATGIVGAIALACCSLIHPNANADVDVAGTAQIYGNVPPDQIESLSTGDRIKAVVSTGAMSNIWATLEHGEKVECIDCIPSVEPLLYDSNVRTREIAAWWLRRRVFGVFGPGEVYDRTTTTLATDPDPVRRAYAASAIGEFLSYSGVSAVATAVQSDQDPGVRAAAATALGRLGDDGNGAIALALGDADATVKLAALKSATRIHGWKNTAALTPLATDGDVHVRRNAAELIGMLRLSDGYNALVAMAADPDAHVRNAAAHALGDLKDARATGILTTLSQSDPDTFVRDQAAIALRRL